MSLIHPIRTACILILLLVSYSLSADTLNNLLFQSENRALLEVHLRKANSHVASNLNRYGLEQLKDYDNQLDLLFPKELEDTIIALENIYLKEAAENINAIESRKQGIKELTQARDESRAKYNHLLRKGVISFGTWLLIVIILLRWRKRKLKKVDLTLKQSAQQFEALELRAKAGKSLIGLSKKLSDDYEALRKKGQQLHESVQQMYDALPAGQPGLEAAKNCIKVSEQLNLKSGREEILNTTLLQLEFGNEEIIPVNINQHCEAILELCLRGFASEENEFIPSTHTDLEKNLPQLKLVPAKLDALLLNVLVNSFQSVRLKAASGINNYKPKINVSTRILPRFLQIRIKDNGEGIPDALLEKIKEEFFSTRNQEEASGLGLPESIRLLNELGKTELKMESDTREGTDVYIKFFL